MLVALPYVLYQVRKPDRWAGRFFLGIMNSSHSALTDWGTETCGHPGKDFKILGCGDAAGGRTIEKLAALAPGGHEFTVSNYADGSVAAIAR